MATLTDTTSATAPTAPTATETILRLLRTDRYRWYHTAAFGLLVNAVSSTAFAGKSDDDYYDHALLSPPFAPPSWAFAPAWAINNIGTLWHNLHLLNMPADTPHREAILRMQAANWALFSTFSTVFFRLRSPVLGAVWTVASFLLMLASAVLTRRTSPRLLLGLATTVAWLALASAVSGYIALRNRDELFGTPAPLTGRDRAASHAA